MTDQRLVNVCFHGIGEPSRELEPGEARYWITTQQFESILDEIATWPTLRISFDDGNRSDIEYGLPALVERGLTATFFVLAGRLTTPGSLDAAAVAELRDAGMTIGSWAYMAPERLSDDQTTKAVDIYALACVLYECLTGRQPFPGDTFERVASGQRSTQLDRRHGPRGAERTRECSHA